MYYSPEITTTLTWSTQKDVFYDYDVVSLSKNTWETIKGSAPGEVNVIAKYKNTTSFTVKIRAYKPPTSAEGQKKSNWCWAAASRMFMENYVAFDSSRTQSEGVYAVKRNYSNEGGTQEQIIKIANYYGWENVNANCLRWVYSEEYTNKFSDDIRDQYVILSEDSLKRLLDNGHVVLINRGKYSTDKKRDSGHASLVVGYRTVKVNGNDQYLYTIYDPWPKNKPSTWNEDNNDNDIERDTTGQKLEWTYQRICQGSYVDAEDWYFWDGFVVVDPGFSLVMTSPTFPERDFFN